ncbi:MAG: hypothetical protein HPZ91_20000 [Lentisphaeria bacterium]|nr:hypothetical protein [Lentisphaeria bacterium]
MTQTRTIATILFAFAAAVAAGEIPFQNGSFEQGTGGYWLNRPAAVRVDTTDSTDGMQCIAITPPETGTTSVVQGVKVIPDTVYVITYDARASVAKGGPQLTMSSMLQGDKPIMIFEGVGEQRKALKTPAAVTDKWQSFTQKIGPFPAQAQGKEVKKAMLYWNVKPGEPGSKLFLDNIRITTEAAPAESAAKPAAKSSGLLSNGSFEQGTAGYWINRSAAVKIEKEDASDGSQCLSIDPPAGATVNVTQGTKFQPGQVYAVTFDARSTVPEGGPLLTLTAMMQGDRPIAFFPGVGAQKNALKTPVALTDKWQTFTLKIGPFPAEAMGKQVKNILFYWNTKQGATPGRLLLDNIRVTVEPAAAETAPAEETQSGAIRFLLPDPVRIFESAPVFTVEAEVGKGHLRVTGADAFGRQVLAAEGKAGEAKLAVALPGPDYYAIRAEIVEGGKAVKTAETSLMVTTPLPKDYYDTPQPAFGVWGGLTPELRRIAGAKWDRQLFFTFFQKPDAPAEPPAPEKIAAKEPIRIIRCMNVLHPFKRMVPLSAQELEEQRAKLTKEIVSRRGLVDVWETQNEPMVGENFHGTMKDVMDIIRMESEVVRRNDPGHTIAGICINPMNANQYNQYVGYYRNHGIDKLIDALMLHPYIPGAQSPDASGYVGTLNRLDRDISAIAGRRIPMYISEIGYSTKPGGEVTELQQAAYLARVVLLNRQIPSLEACVWHIGLWNEATSRRELDFGLLRGHAKDSKIREPKPGFAAWATVSRMTYDADYVRELNISRQVRVLLFNKRGKAMLAAYSLTAEPAKLQLPLNIPEASLTEVCGKRSTVPLQDGILSLTLTEAPVYIEGGELDAFNADRFAAVFEPEAPATSAGAPVTIKITLPEELAKGNVNMRVPAGEFGTPSVTGSGRNWQVTVTPGAGIKPGAYDLFFRLESDGRSRYIWQKPLEIVPPMTITDLRSTHVDGLPAVTFRTVCNDGKSANAVVEILENGDRTLAIAQIIPGKESTMPLHLTRSGRPAAYQARFTLPDGKSWMQKLPEGLVPVSIPRVDNALAKPLESWPESSRYAIGDGTPSRHAVRGEFDRPEGTIRLAYDDTFLYFAIDQKDAVFKTRPGASLWDADGLQIGVSVPQTFMIRPNNDGIQETAYAEFGVHAGTEQPNSWAWASMNLNEMPLNQPVPGLIAKNGRTGDTTVYRFAVPWKSLNIKPAPQMPLGISILFNDRDDARDRHWVEWYSGIADGKDPSRYGSAVLLP